MFYLGCKCFLILAIAASVRGDLGLSRGVERLRSQLPSLPEADGVAKLRALSAGVDALLSSTEREASSLVGGLGALKANHFLDSSLADDLQGLELPSGGNVMVRDLGRLLPALSLPADQLSSEQALFAELTGRWNPRHITVVIEELRPGANLTAFAQEVVASLKASPLMGDALKHTRPRRSLIDVQRYPSSAAQPYTVNTVVQGVADPLPLEQMPDYTSGFLGAFNNEFDAQVANYNTYSETKRQNLWVQPASQLTWNAAAAQQTVSQYNPVNNYNAFAYKQDSLNPATYIVPFATTGANTDAQVEQVVYDNNPFLKGQLFVSNFGKRMYANSMTELPQGTIAVRNPVAAAKPASTGTAGPASVPAYNSAASYTAGSPNTAYRPPPAAQSAVAAQAYRPPAYQPPSVAAQPAFKPAAFQQAAATRPAAPAFQATPQAAARPATPPFPAGVPIQPAASSAQPGTAPSAASAQALSFAQAAAAFAAANGGAAGGPRRLAGEASEGGVAVPELPSLAALLAGGAALKSERAATMPGLLSGDLPANHLASALDSLSSLSRGAETFATQLALVRLKLQGGLAGSALNFFADDASPAGRAAAARSFQALRSALPSDGASLFVGGATDVLGGHEASRRLLAADQVQSVAGRIKSAVNGATRLPAGLKQIGASLAGAGASLGLPAVPGKTEEAEAPFFASLFSHTAPSTADRDLTLRFSGLSHDADFAAELSAMRAALGGVRPRNVNLVFADSSAPPPQIVHDIVTAFCGSLEGLTAVNVAGAPAGFDLPAFVAGLRARQVNVFQSSALFGSTSGAAAPAVFEGISQSGTRPTVAATLDASRLF